MGNLQPYSQSQKYIDEASEKLSDFVSEVKLNWSPFEFMTMSTSSMLASKHFDLVMALDIHWILIAGVPVPLPYPFFGIIFDPADYLSLISIPIPAIPALGISEPMTLPLGSSVMVNKRFKSATTTCVFGLVPPMMNHIGPLAMPPMGVNDGEVYFGSESVFTCGVEMSAGDCKVLTCWDPPFASMVLPTNPRKGFKFPLALYNYPTSMKMLISSGNPVMVGGMKVPHKYTMAEMAMRLAALFGMKALGKLFKKAGKAFNNLLKKMFGQNSKLSKALCRFGFDPVNLVTGEVVYDGIDFELSGSIPIRWERSWGAFSEYEGMLGHGVSCSYDLRLKVDVRHSEGIGVVLPDGRAVGFDLLLPGTSFFNRTEKMTLTFDGENYSLFDHQTKLTYRYKKIRTGEFEEHAVTQIVNENNFKIELNYNHQGQLFNLVDSVGRDIHLELDDKGRVINIEAAHKGEQRKLVSYAYNDAGDMISITDALGQSTVIGYFDQLMTKKTDRNGQSFYWEYDSKKRCTHTWGDDGLLEGFLTFNEGHTVVRDSKGESIYFFDENNLITEIQDALGNSQYFSYNEHFELISETDAEEFVTFHTYDERGNKIQTNLPNGANLNWVYNEDGDLEEVIDGEGGSQYYEYDDEGRLRDIIKADGTELSFSYNDLGQLTGVKNEEGGLTYFDYDEDQNLSGVRKNEKLIARWSYDIWGRNTRVLSADMNEQEFVYDQLDRVINIESSDARNLELKYNAYNEVIQAIDGQRNVQFTYTPLGSLKTRSEQGRKIFFHYDKDENLKSIANEKNEYYYFKRNAASQVTFEQSFDGLTREYDRDRNGNIVRINRPEERWTEYEYDPGGNIIRAQYSDDTFEVYDYDKNGKLIAAINQHSEVGFKRNSLGQLMEETQNGYKVFSEYNRRGFRNRLRSSLGADLCFEFDDLGNNTKISLKNGEEDRWKAIMKHSSVGQEIERSFSNGLMVKNEFGSNGLLSNQVVKNQQSVVGRKSYKWDVNNRLISIFDKLKKGACDFGYDALGNLAYARYEDGSYDYKMPDSVGNLYNTKGREDRKYNVGSRLMKDETFGYRYDQEGNLVEKKNRVGETWKYEWYGNGMLKAVVQNEKNRTEFEYDALGRRIQKQSSKTKRLTRFVWDGNVPLHEWNYSIQEKPNSFIDERGKLAWNGEEPMNDLITWVFNPETFVPTAKITEDGTYSIVTDHLGTPTQAYDENGEKVWDCQLDIYGKIRKLEGERSLIPFRYQGQYEDVETGLYYNRFRYYSSESGVYLSQDPIGLVGGNPNLYAYVFDSNREIDPFGLDCMQKRLGDFGEKWAKEQLEASGKYKKVFSVQNNSNHGIDLVGMRSDGKFDIFEVKTNVSGNVGELSARQVNPNFFINDVLTKAQGGSFGISKNMAQNIANNIGDTRIIDVFVKHASNGRWYVNKGMISIW